MVSGNDGSTGRRVFSAGIGICIGVFSFFSLVVPGISLVVVHRLYLTKIDGFEWMLIAGYSLIGVGGLLCIIAVILCIIACIPGRNNDVNGGTGAVNQGGLRWSNNQVPMAAYPTGQQYNYGQPGQPYSGQPVQPHQYGQPQYAFGQVPVATSVSPSAPGHQQLDGH